MRRAFVLFLATLLSITAVGWMCMPFCIDTDSMSPQDLIEFNEHVFIGFVESVDTVAHLGTFDYQGSYYETIVVEYVIAPSEVFKGCQGVDNFRLWYESERKVGTDWWKGPGWRPFDTALVYGNTLKSGDNIIKMLQASIDSPPEAYIELLTRGATTADLGNTRTYDSAVARAALYSAELRTARDSAKPGSPILYTTDEGMLTSHEFSSGNIGYCDRFLRTGFLVTSQEYLKKLRAIAD